MRGHVCFRVPGIYTALKRVSIYFISPPCFRVPGIYTALKRHHATDPCSGGFRVPGIYTALKLMGADYPDALVLEYLEFTQLSNTASMLL